MLRTLSLKQAEGHSIHTHIDIRKKPVSKRQGVCVQVLDGSTEGAVNVLK